MPHSKLKVATLAPIAALGLALILMLCIGALLAAIVTVSARAAYRAAVHTRDAARRCLPAEMGRVGKKPAAASRAG